MKNVPVCFSILILIAGCQSKKPLFHQVSPSHTGIYFNNKIIESDSFNIISQENIYNGGGVGIADFNNDGLQDIYFTGNMVGNKLYQNKGNLRFTDITARAGVEGEGKWARGVSIADINNDGWQDIYLSETVLHDSVKRENILYINQGLNKDHSPVFKNMAEAYGLNDNSHTTQAAFFDYDNDGDLDVYLAVNVFAPGDNPNAYRKILTHGEHPNTDRLYRNDWDSAKAHPYFTNVSRQAGILQEGFAHAVTVCDINLDGWKDIYVTNDYLSENILYVNNGFSPSQKKATNPLSIAQKENLQRGYAADARGEVTFTNRCKDYFKHTSFNAMGADVVDINNDGLSDVIELDMNPEDNYRKKTMLGSADYQTYWYNDNYSYQYQFVRNTLQLNMGKSVAGKDSLSHPVFADIGFYSGIAETDWSWAPLVADFDNDGFRDIIVTNGFPKDVTDHDFMIYRNSAFAMNVKEKLLSQIPEVKIPNYAFHNNGNLTFLNVTKDWGLGQPTFSNGAAVADLDNDGDLDVVISNINAEALVYENKLNEQADKPHHYLRVLLQGNPVNSGAFGAWLKIYYDKNKQQVYETNPVRGYLSSGPNETYFGLGETTTLDSLIVIWPDNKKQKLTDVKSDQRLVIKKDGASKNYSWQQPVFSNAWFEEISDSLNLKYDHHQRDFNDFAIQPLLPHKLSQYGPGMAVGDINNDGLEDLAIGGSAGNSAAIFFQQPNGKFERKNVPDSATSSVKLCDDTGLLLFDAEADHDLDLYICSGGYQQPGATACQNRLYINDGKGKYSPGTSALPVTRNSKSCVRAIDFDKDGDVDLFIGERVEPWNYPKPVSGILLRNDSKNGLVKFTDVTPTMAPALKNIGLICDAISTDYNNDGWPDLIIAGEWMPLIFLKNQQGIFVNETANSGIDDKHGWWNCLYEGDFDKDGKMDYVAGNLGKNSFFNGNQTFPLHNYFNDFDKNGRFETITTKFMKDRQGRYKEYTAQSRDEVLLQLPALKKRYLTYKSFAAATVDQLFTESQFAGAVKGYANYFASSYVHNLGNGKFELIPLPAMAQLAPVFGMIAQDFNQDGNLDILLAGNDYGAEVFNGRLDALNGAAFSGDGKGNFEPLSIQQSGFYVSGDARALIKLKNPAGNHIFAVSKNKGALKAFVLKKK